MQILDITTGIDAPFYCPFTGGQLFGEDFEASGDSPHLQGVWISEAIDTPELLKGEMKQAWNGNDSEDLEFREWLAARDLSGHFAIEISHGAPIGITAWYVFKSDLAAS
jgi:hypothetical protein